MHGDPQARTAPRPAEPRELEVTLPGREDLPPLVATEPYTGDEPLADLDAMDAAFAAWSETPVARTYHDQDQRHQPRRLRYPGQPRRPPAPGLPPGC